MDIRDKINAAKDSYIAVQQAETALAGLKLQDSILHGNVHYHCEQTQDYDPIMELAEFRAKLSGIEL